MFKYKNENNELLVGKIIIHSIVGLFLLVLMLNSFTIIGAGERGVVLSFGAFNGKIFNPGLNFKIPFAQSVVKMSVRTEKIEVEKSEAYSHDLQVVDIHSVINYNLDPMAVGVIYQQYNLDFASKVLRPNLEASVKQTIAKYTAEELLSKRAEVQNQIEDSLKTAVPPQFLITKYALVNEQFSQQFEDAIESKQVALQKAEQAKNELTKAEIDAKSRVATASGEAEAIKIQAQAVTQQGGADYVKLQWIKQWDGHLPSTMLGDSTPLVNIGR